ncbi:MAG: Hsp70 family protein, partial [Clostridia bacterium]|nr:Hsp70 family protein [Clostridia bacterium]
DRAVKDAEKFAEEDKKQKEAVEVKNRAESVIFQSQKTLDEIGDKVSESEKENVRSALEKLKETVKGNDTEAIKADTEALEKSFYALSEKLYKESGSASAGQENPGSGASNDGTYYNADFEDKSNQ